MLRPCWHPGVFAVVVGTVLGAAPTSHAQDVVLNQMYGVGVHSYFSGNYPQAMSDLTTVIDAGSSDPRAFYFRGLAAMRLRMNDNAEQDFRRGAELEAKSFDRFYPVSRSLERVQGYDRVALERHRAQARAIAYQEKQKREQARYEQLRRAEEAVVRPAPAAPEAPAAAPAKAAADEEPAAPPADDPFAEKPEAPVDAPAEEPAEAAAEEDPFAAGGEEPAEEKPAEEKAPAEEPASEEDPFAAGADEAAPKEEMKAEEEPAAKEKPAAKEEAAADDDPFADDAPAGEKEEAKADDKDDAKADEKKPDAKADEEDPFGN